MPHVHHKHHICNIRRHRKVVMWPHINHMRNICYVHNHHQLVIGDVAPYSPHVQNLQYPRRHHQLVMLPHVHQMQTVCNIHKYHQLVMLPTFTICIIFVMFTSIASWWCCPIFEFSCLSRSILAESRKVSSSVWLDRGRRYSQAWTKAARPNSSTKSNEISALLGKTIFTHLLSIARAPI